MYWPPLHGSKHPQDHKCTGRVDGQETSQARKQTPCPGSNQHCCRHSKYRGGWKACGNVQFEPEVSLRTGADGLVAAAVASGGFLAHNCVMLSSSLQPTLMQKSMDRRHGRPVKHNHTVFKSTQSFVRILWLL